MSERIDRLRAAGLLDGTPDALLDRASRTASRLLGTPVALVSLVTDDRQVFAGQTGLPAPWDQSRQTPLTHSVCQFLVEHDVTLGFDDLKHSRWVRQVIDVDDLAVGSYLGVPLHDATGAAIGAFCVIDPEPRTWTEEDHRALDDLAAFVDEILRVRTLAAELAADLRAVELEQAGLAHDLRGQAAAIRSGVETLQRPELDDADREPVVDVVNRKVEQFERTVTSVLASAAGDVELEPVDVTAVLRDVADRLTDRFGLAARVTSSDGVAVTSDERLLRRVLVNLADNAGKYAGEGATVTLGAALAGDELVLDVADDGPGFDVDDPEAPFEAFRRGDGVGAGTPGSGLGLYIVRRLVERLGGTVRLDPTHSPGARVEVRLPCEPA